MSQFVNQTINCASSEVSADRDYRTIHGCTNGFARKDPESIYRPIFLTIGNGVPPLEDRTDPATLPTHVQLVTGRDSEGQSRVQCTFLRPADEQINLETASDTRYGEKAIEGLCYGQDGRDKGEKCTLMWTVEDNNLFHGKPDLQTTVDLQCKGVRISVITPTKATTKSPAEQLDSAASGLLASPLTCEGGAPYADGQYICKVCDDDSGDSGDCPIAKVPPTLRLRSEKIDEHTSAWIYDLWGDDVECKSPDDNQIQCNSLWGTTGQGVSPPPPGWPTPERPIRPPQSCTGKHDCDGHESNLIINSCDAQPGSGKLPLKLNLTYTNPKSGCV